MHFIIYIFYNVYNIVYAYYQLMVSPKSNLRMCSHCEGNGNVEFTFQNEEMKFSLKI